MRLNHAGLSGLVVLGFGALALGLVGATPASAGLILSVDAKGGFGGSTGMVLINANFNAVATQEWAGVQLASLNGGPKFDAYCDDLEHDNIVPVSFPVNLVPIANLANGNKIGYLDSRDAWSAANDHIKSAGLQVAIWETKYTTSFVDTDTPLANGTDAQKVAYQANLYLADLAAHYDPGTTYHATSFEAIHVGNLYQSVVGPGTGTFESFKTALVAPEPGTLVTAIVGILGLLAVGRFRKTTVTLA